MDKFATAYPFFAPHKPDGEEVETLDEIEIPYNIIFKYIPADTPDDEIERIILTALEQYFIAHPEKRLTERE